MKRQAMCVWVAGLLAVVLLAAPVWAQRTDADQLTAAQKKLLAYRAARADAIRKLTEQIKGVQIDSETTVKDFVTESDYIHTQLKGVVIRGMREVGEPRYYANGMCELTMEITLRTVITELKSLHAKYYKAGQYKAMSFDKYQQYNKYTKVTAVGSGAEPASFQEVQPVAVPGAPPGAPKTLAWAVVPGWENVAPQGWPMAARAARLDAMRKLGERIHGLQLDSETTVRDFVTESDIIRTRMGAFLKGFKEEGPTEYLPNQTAKVVGSITLRQIWATIDGVKAVHQKDASWKSLAYAKVTKQVHTGKFIESGYGAVPPKYIVASTVVQGLATGPQPPAWVGSPVQAVGSSSISAQLPDNPTQKQLMAMRAAEVDAKRKLGETVWGLKINATTTVKDFVATNDVIQTDLDVFLSGARVVKTDVLGDIVQVTVEIDPQGLWNNVIKQRLGG